VSAPVKSVSSSIESKNAQMIDLYEAWSYISLAQMALSAKTLDACCRRHDDQGVIPATAGIQQPSVPWHTALRRQPLLHERIMTTSHLYRHFALLVNNTYRAASSPITPTRNTKYE
jgi:hypothetical protein